jgi:geranylgeranyl diphosphate synthase type II
LGLAFQLQDDYLDAFGNPETFGKQVGGDIIENKKTFLYLKALALSNPNDQATLIELFSKRLDDNALKIEKVKEIFKRSGADKTTEEAIEQYTLEAFSTLEKMNIAPDKTEILKVFGSNLMKRKV